MFLRPKEIFTKWGVEVKTVTLQLAFGKKQWK